MVEEYRYGKQVAGYVEDSIYEITLTLRHFERLVGGAIQDSDGSAVAIGSPVSER
jgi:hypothetical protein